MIVGKFFITTKQTLFGSYIFLVIVCSPTYDYTYFSQVPLKTRGGSNLNNSFRISSYLEKVNVYY